MGNGNKTQVAFPVYPIENAPNIDYRYGPYQSMAAALQALGPNGLDCIVPGLRFGILAEDGSVTDYKFTAQTGEAIPVDGDQAGSAAAAEAMEVAQQARTDAAQAKADAASAATHAANADTVAGNAMDLANETATTLTAVQQATAQAQSTANNAQASAAQAQQTATNAQASASSAVETAAQAMEVAQQAQQAAGSGFYGYFASSADLPQGVTDIGYACVGTKSPYEVWNFDGTSWSDSGTTMSKGDVQVDNEDLTENASGLVQFKDRGTSYSSKGYVRVRKNLVTASVKKTYDSVTYIHGVETTHRTASTATSSASYDSATQYFSGNPTSRYGKEAGFPQAGNASVRKSAPFVMLNKADRKVYYRWQWNKGGWSFGDIYYDGWGEKPSDKNFTVEDGKAKTFAYVEYGVTHYVHWTGSAWLDTDATERTEISLLASDAFSLQDTVYEIVYDMDLNGETLRPATGVVLKYAGGKIKNGTIDFSSGNVIIDCPDVQFFENIKIIKSWSQVMKDVWFDDIWMSMTTKITKPEEYLFTCTAISLSKNHKVDFKHGEIAVRDNPSRKLTIYGNGYKLTVDNTYRPSGGQLFACSAIAIYDLNIELTDKDIQTYNAIFNTSNVFMKGVVYRGYSRFAANWNNDSYSLSALELHDCDLRATAFLFENSYNKVRIYNSQLRYLNPQVRHYYELISIGAYINPASVENCNVEVYDTYIGGVWELGDRTKIDGVVNGYGYMKFHNCELVRFTTDNSQKTRGITDVIYEDCHFKTCNLPWRTSCIGTVTYKNCWFDIFGDQVGMTAAGPFDFWNLKSATFEGCTFRKTSFTDPEVTTKDGTSYPQGYTYPPLGEIPIITIAPPANIVNTVNDGDTELKENEEWDFTLYLYGNRIIVNDDIKEGYTYRPYSRFFIRTVNPNSLADKVILTDAQAKKLIVSKGNSFVHSIHGISGYTQSSGSVGCSVYLNNRKNIIPVDNTVFVVHTDNTSDPGIDYANANFGYCDTNFTFIDASTSVPRYGRYNAATNKVAWLTYSAEENVPGNA